MNSIIHFRWCSSELVRIMYIPLFELMGQNGVFSVSVHARNQGDHVLDCIGLPYSTKH